MRRKMHSKCIVKNKKNLHVKRFYVKINNRIVIAAMDFKKI